MPFDEIVESSAPVFDPVDMGVAVTQDIVSWPWPRLMSSAYHTFLFMEGAEESLLLYELILDEFDIWMGTFVGNIGSVPEVNTVEVIDFGHYYVVLVVGATTRNFAKLIGNEIVELAQPLFATGCNNNGQFVGGNISNWQDLGSDGIVWSGIGSYEFDPQRDQTSGFKTLVCGKVPGKRVTVQRILPYMNGIIIYTDFGNVFLTDRLVGNSFVYGLDELEGTGVASGNHVAGNNYTQMFINLNNELCKYQKTKEVKILGYKRQIEDLKSSGTELIMSFLEDRNTFFLSNGVYTLVINDYGASTVHQAINGLVEVWDGRIYGTFRDFEDREARVTLDSLSMDSRGIKTLEWVLADINYDPGTACHASCYWKNNASEEWRAPLWKNGSPSGEFFLGISAVEYRINVRFSEYEGSEIFALKVNAKYPDLRTRRGIMATSGVQRDANT